MLKGVEINPLLTFDEEHGSCHEEGHDQGDQHHCGGVILEHLLEPGLEAKHFNTSQKYINSATL